MGHYFLDRRYIKWVTRYFLDISSIQKHLLAGFRYHMKEVMVSLEQLFIVREELRFDRIVQLSQHDVVGVGEDAEITRGFANLAKVIKL